MASHSMSVGECDVEIFSRRSHSIDIEATEQYEVDQKMVELPRMEELLELFYADDGVIGHEDPEKVQALADAFTVWFKRVL